MGFLFEDFLFLWKALNLARLEIIIYRWRKWRKDVKGIFTVNAQHQLEAVHSYLCGKDSSSSLKCWNFMEIDKNCESEDSIRPKAKIATFQFLAQLVSRFWVVLFVLAKESVEKIWEGTKKRKKINFFHFQLFYFPQNFLKFSLKTK